tara:strand:+ start:794 stop:1300 length:507 start_codon:yes stop_codon:yes gene_type:complete
LDSKIIIDSTAFYAGLPFRSLDCYYTTIQINEELQKIPFFSSRIETLIHSNRLQIIEPSSKAVEYILKNSLNIENKKSLSDADISILALAYDFLEENHNVIVLTDDYAIQNVAKKLDIFYKSLLYSGIKYSGKWINFCSACSSISESNDKTCINCGNPLKRKLQRRHP